jgi:hypothetical protein
VDAVNEEPHDPEKLDVVSDDIAESSPLSGLGTGAQLVDTLLLPVLLH